MNTVVCPHCSCPTEPGRFCARCGGRLSAAAATKPPATPAPLAGTAPPEGVAMPSGVPVGCPSVPVAFPQPEPVFPGSFFPPRIEPLPAPPPLPPLQPLGPLASPLESQSTAAVAPAVPSKDPFSLSCSLPERFVEGMTAVILLKAKRSGRLKERMRISLVDGDRTLAGPVERNLDASGIEIPLNCRPEHAGSLSVQIRIESLLADSTEAEVRLATLILPVEPASGCGGGLSLQVNNSGIFDFQSLGLAERLGASGKDYVATTSNPRQFRPVEGLVLLATPTRITLELGETRLHAVSRAPAWFGRQNERPKKGRLTDNAVVLLAFSQDGSVPDLETSSYISRSHFLVERDGDRIRLRDGSPARDDMGNILPGGPVAASAGGLSVNGTRLAPRGGFSIAAGREAEVVLVPGVHDGGALSLRLSGVPDAFASHGCAGALLRRNDAVAEAYLPMWGAVDLGAADAALAGWILSWDGARFLLRDPSGDEQALAAGRSFGPPGKPVRALPFCQKGT